MRRIVSAILFIVCCTTFFKLLSQEADDIQPYQNLFNKAELLFTGAATDSTDSVALHCYTQVTEAVKPTALTALLLFNSYERSGILKQGLGYANEDILKDYYAGLALQKSYHLNDSILFRLLLSAGNVHYANAHFDSAIFYFSLAEKIIDKYPSAGLAGDLYNSLGAIYSEAGNYMQSGVYFNKALELTKKNHPELKEAIFAMSANIASAIRLSGNPDSALRLYKQLLNPKAPVPVIINNISGIYLIKKEPDSALHYLQLVKDISGNYGIAVYNSFAQAYMQKNDVAKAAHYLTFADSLYQLKSPLTKNNYYAATKKYFGDLMMITGKPGKALRFYQQAIIQYDFNFNDTNIFVNPGNFIGEFASYNLFDALTAKANCFATIFNVDKKDEYFTGAINTYDSAFALADYIKKSINNDEARSFIADKVFAAYIQAVDFLLSLNNPDEDKLEHALKWISKSRAASLAINLKENTIKQYAGLPDSLLQKERNIKIGISRLKLQLQQTTDTSEEQQITSAINSATLQLQTVENSFKDYKDYYRQKFAADNIDINNIQKNILTGNNAVICYFKGAEKMYAFVIKSDKIYEHEIISDKLLQKNIELYANELVNSKAGKLYNEKPGRYLFSKLAQPLLNEIKNTSSLIIIPDQDLINIPFESFKANNGKFLIEEFAITYQYALPLLQLSKDDFDKNKAIAFAPFTYSNANSTMQVLSSSVDEISGFEKDRRLIGEKATKNKFMSLAGNAPAIHLATHAVANFSEPENAYIAFYPYNKTDSAYKMYAHELYNLRLPQTKFVFLSACETGSGKLSQSEGALSLSRAFAFAGCPDVVTSLWKAEDKSTAYISERFYKYVADNYTYAVALQKAKTDLLNDGSMVQFHSPAYWAHLVFIGNVQEERSLLWLWIIIGGLIVIVLSIIIYKRKDD